MSETRAVTLGGRTFQVPPLPLRVTMKVYPACRALTIAGFTDRCLAAGGLLETSDDEMAQVAEIVFLCAQTAEPALTRDEFEALPITPPELLDAYLVARYQTGAWIAPDPPAPGEETPAGEAMGAGESPPTSTSTASSPA